MISTSAIQTLTPPNYLGRVFSFDITVFFLGKSISMAIGGLFVEFQWFSFAYDYFNLEYSTPRTIAFVGALGSIIFFIYYAIFNLIYWRIKEHKIPEIKE